MRHLLLPLLLAPALSAAPASSQAPALRTDIQNFVKAYGDAVNRGDISAVAEMYKQSPDLLTIGDGEITRGWGALRDQLNEVLGLEGNYKIAIGAIDVVPLGPGRALAIGPFVLTLATEAGPAQVRGAITLVLEKVGNRWLIVHDHTSVKPAQQQ